MTASRRSSAGAPAPGGTLRPLGDSPRVRAPSARTHVPSPWWGVILLLVLAAAFVGLAIGGLYLWFATAPAEVRVPDVTAINLRAAEAILARRGLVGQTVAHRYHEQLAAGGVISETPPAGRSVRQGRTIELFVSDGPPWVLMPDVREIELGRARESLAKADLRLARIRRRYDEASPSGWVIEQTPAAQTRVARRARVELTVSAGPRPRAEPAAAPPQAKQAVVEVVLPEGERDYLVRIEVEDERGTTVIHTAWHQPGSTVTQVATGYGDAIARVYVDGALIKEDRF